ncbi:MAG: RHS repeat-associated core domain-containing protein, partial [bacterium]|nr:RHS repeat-associated core domain-containing protein [bacterium]
AAVVAYYEFDPYGNPIDNTNSGDPYGYTGEWYEGYIDLLHLRARWYSHETGTFLSVDPVESEPPYQYVRGNVVNLVDPYGYCGEAYYPDDGFNAVISQQCYELANEFIRELSEAGIQPSLPDGRPAPIRSYNLEVLKALHRKWGGHRQRAQIKLPYPDQLSVGQPFEVIST